MSRATPTVTAPKTPPVNAPKKDVNQLETAWIDWLNRSNGSKAGESGAAKDLTNKRGIDLLADTEFDATRFKTYNRQVELEKARFDLIRGSVAKATATEVDKLEHAARVSYLTQDLSVPKNNEVALAAISALERRINLACSTELCPGAGVELKRIAVLEKSAEFKAADALSNAACTTAITEIKDIFKAKPPKLTEAQQKLAALEKTCQDTVRSDTAVKAKIDLAVIEYQRVAALAQTKKLSPEALGPFNEYLAKAAELLRTANKARPVAPPVVTAGKLEQSVRDYGIAVQGFLDKSKLESDKAEKFANDFALIGNDPAKKKTFAELTAAQDAISANYDAAVTAGMAADDQKKKDCLAYKGSTVTPDQLRSAKEFVAAIELAFDALYTAWEVEKTKHAKLIKFGLQLSASTSETADEDLGEVDQRSAAAKQMQTNAAWCLKQYDEAIAQAKQRLYQAAIDTLNLAIDGDGGTNKGLATLQTEAGDALKATKADPQDLKDRETAFTTALGDVTDKSRIRFDKDAMDLMMGAGVTADEDGNLIYSEQFKAMQAQLEKGLTMWHGLCDKGVDPFKAAERAFEGIPENFWPPEAVRVIALFRKAEAEFASEREAAELQAEIQNGGLKKLDKGIDIGGAIAQHGAERAKDVAEGAMAAFKTILQNQIGEEAFKKLKDADIQTKAQEYYKANGNIDLKGATDALGGLAAGFGALNAGYKIGKDLGAIEDTSEKIKNYDPETDSPVKLKMHEFERQRAIWHLINDMADAIVSCMGAASQAVPALSMVGDCKALVLDTIDALQYFNRLREVKAIKNTAKLDPETLAELALANEADKLGLLGSQKTFDAATALIKVIGGGVELGGITAAAGFGIKAGGTVLQYCGKGVFALIKWNDRRNAIKILLAARANPTDILYVEPVFEKCTMYSRYLLADGALNGDTWCKRYIISRGVTDTDLDNPNTSCAILREYLNVTFEVMSGDAQEDDDLRTGKREKKEKAKQPSEEVDYNGTWQASDVDPAPAKFENNYKGALGADLAPNPKTVKRVKQVLQEYSAALLATEGLIEKFDEAFEEFEAALDAKPRVPDDVKNATETAKAALQAALDKAAEAAGCVSMCSRELVGFEPLSNKKDGQKKSKIHAAFQTYLQELRQSVALAYDPIADFRNTVSKKAMALALGMKPGDDNFVESAQEEFKNLAESVKVAINETNVRIEKSINDQWDAMTISSKTGGKGTKVKMIKNAATKLKVGEPDITSAVDKRFNAVKRPIVQTALGIGAKVTTERLSKLEEANKEKDEKKRKKQVKKIEAEAKKRIQKEAVEFSIEKAKQLLASEFDAAVGEVFATKAPDTAKYVHTAPLALTREYWHAEKDRLKAKKWKFVKTGVGPAAEEFQEAKKNWELLPKDDRLQGEYNGAYGSLLKKLNNIPLATEDGVELPGMKAMKTGLIAILKADKAEFDRRIVDPTEEDPKENQADGWVVADSKLKTWPITQDGWVLMHDLAEKHGWEGHNSKRSLGKYFRHFGEARQEFQDATEPTEKETAKGSARKYADELKKELTKWDPNKKMLRTKPAHKGIMRYQAVTITVLTELLTAGELKA